MAWDPNHDITTPAQPSPSQTRAPTVGDVSPDEEEDSDDSQFMQMPGMLPAQTWHQLTEEDAPPASRDQLRQTPAPTLGAPAHNRETSPHISTHGEIQQSMATYQHESPAHQSDSHPLTPHESQRKSDDETRNLKLAALINKYRQLPYIESI